MCKFCIIIIVIWHFNSTPFSFFVPFVHFFSQSHFPSRPLPYFWMVPIVGKIPQIYSLSLIIWQTPELSIRCQVCTFFMFIVRYRLKKKEEEDTLSEKVSSKRINNFEFLIFFSSTGLSSGTEGQVLMKNRPMHFQRQRFGDFQRQALLLCVSDSFSKVNNVSFL